jgi:hypothetical protein
MSTIPTVLHTKKEYGMNIFLPLKGRNDKNDERIFLKGNKDD